MPKFTRRHHEIVANLFAKRQKELLSIHRTPVASEAHRNEWYTLQRRFKEVFTKDNERFSPTKFDKACGLPGRTILIEEVDGG